jgi:SPP1 gp7 family putative phage head morphogenesis protein
MNMSDRLASALTASAIDLSRFEAGERSKLLAIFKALETELLAAFRKIDPTEPSLSTYQQQRLEKLIIAVRGTITSAYREMSTTLRRDLKALSLLEAQGIQTLVGELTVDSMFSVLPSESVLRTLVDDAVLMGRPLQRWWSAQATGLKDRYAAEIRAGLLRGDSTNDISRSLRGTRERNYQDGAFAPSAKNVQTLVRTSVQAVANESRLAVFSQNQDVLRGVEFLTAMDEAVCPICRPYSGATYSLDHHRLPGTKLPYPGSIPLHPNCRCMWLPLIRSYPALTSAKGPRFQSDVQDLSQETKQQLDGGNGVDLTFTQWLKSQPEAVQREVLGPSRWKLWRAGKLPLHAMINGATQKPYTLEQLKARRRRRVA